MAIHSFLKAEKGDPDWQFSPAHYFGKEFKIVDASTVEIAEDVKDMMVLRQNPTDKNLLAKHIKIESRKNSYLDLIVINDADDKLQQVFMYDIHLKQDSTINFGIFVHGGKFNKHIIQVTMDEGANFSAYGLMVNNCGGDTEIITKVAHQNPETSSRQLILGLAGEGSQTVYQGMVVLDEGSDHSDASVESMNLAAGKRAQCCSKPEVYANIQNVKSSLGSITEYMSEDKIYYLQARGLTPKQAEKTIIDSFQKQVLNLVSFEDLRSEIAEIFE